MPTDSQWPPVNVRPCDSRNGASSRPPLTAGRAVADLVRRSVISRMSPRSISSASSRTLQPAQLWPPERTETCQPRSRASRTPSTTSSSDAANSTAAGVRSAGLRALKMRLVARRLEARWPRSTSSHDHRLHSARSRRSTSSTRLPSGSATNAKRTPGSGDGRGETFSPAPASSARANSASMSGALTAKCP